MKFSIQGAVALIIGLLFLASLLFVYFAISKEQIMPLILVASANIIAVILLSFLITRGIMDPLKRIRKIIKQVGEGDLTRRITFKTTQELQEVGEAFNDMIIKLQSAKQGAENTNKILEQKVKDRTQQLRDLTSSLEGKVEIRTKELQEKVEELERFQKLTVGRELRMIELKESMQKLESKESKTRKRSPDNNHKKSRYGRKVSKEDQGTKENPKQTRSGI